MQMAVPALEETMTLSPEATKFLASALPTPATELLMMCTRCFCWQHAADAGRPAFCAASDNYIERGDNVFAVWACDCSHGKSLTCIFPTYIKRWDTGNERHSGE